MPQKRTDVIGEKAYWCWLRCLCALWRRPRSATSPEPAPPFLPSSATAPPPNEPDTLRRILIVEDDAKVAEVIRDALRLEGSGAWEALTARSGEEALRMVEAQPVDLILLDVRLPGISGAEVYRRLRAAPTTHRLPIIFLSGGTSFDLSREGVQEGILLRKPFNIPELLAVVRANLPASSPDSFSTETEQ